MIPCSEAPLVRNLQLHAHCNINFLEKDSSRLKWCPNAMYRAAARFAALLLGFMARDSRRACVCGNECVSVFKRKATKFFRWHDVDVPALGDLVAFRRAEQSQNLAKVFVRARYSCYWSIYCARRASLLFLRVEKSSLVFV